MTYYSVANCNPHYITLRFTTYEEWCGCILERSEQNNTFWKYYYIADQKQCCCCTTEMHTLACFHNQTLGAFVNLFDLQKL